jgi:hypothetical protein
MNSVSVSRPMVGSGAATVSTLAMVSSSLIGSGRTRYGDSASGMATTWIGSDVLHRL